MGMVKMKKASPISKVRGEVIRIRPPVPMSLIPFTKSSEL